MTDGTSDGNQCRFEFQFQNDEAWLSSLWEEQQQPHLNTDKMNVPVSSSSSSSSDPNNLSTRKDFLWMAHITGPSMLAMVDLGPALCEFAIRARKWVHAHDLDNTSDENRSSAENVESLLERFISKEHELAFEMLREDIIKTDVSTLYVRGDAMVPVGA